MIAKGFEGNSKEGDDGREPSSVLVEMGVRHKIHLNVQGYLAHTKQWPPRTLQWECA